MDTNPQKLTQKVHNEISALWQLMGGYSLSSLLHKLSNTGLDKELSEDEIYSISLKILNSIGETEFINILFKEKTSFIKEEFLTPIVSLISEQFSVTPEEILNENKKLIHGIKYYRGMCCVILHEIHSVPVEYISVIFNYHAKNIYLWIANVRLLNPKNIHDRELHEKYIIIRKQILTLKNSKNGQKSIPA